MNMAQGNQTANLRRVLSMAGAVAVVACLTGCSHAMMMFGTGARRPAITEFGLGPRGPPAAPPARGPHHRRR
jgi:hypothetical protein